MDQDVMAHRVALWVQALQNAQRAKVLVTRDRALALQTIVQLKLRVPGHGVAKKSVAREGSGAQVFWLPRCAQPVVRFSIALNSSYMSMAMAPTTTNPAKARPICIADPAEISR